MDINAEKWMTKDNLPHYGEFFEKVKPHYATNWRASDDLLEALPALLSDVVPQTILEFGPGLSSYILQYYTVGIDGLYIGIDHEGEYGRAHLARLANYGFDPSHTHIFDVAKDDQWYNIDIIEKLISLAPFDLILLDGPGSDDARSCARALDLFKQIAAPDRTSWIIDDTNRQASAWLAGTWIPKFMSVSATTVIRDRNYARTTSVITTLTLIQ